MFGKRKTATYIEGCFPTANKERIREFELLEKKDRIKKLEEDIEYNCNTPVYFFYTAYVYTADTYNKHKKILDKKKSISKYEEELIKTLKSAYDIMTDAYNNFLSYCDNEQDKEYVKRLLEHSTFLVAENTENQMSAIFYAIKKYYMSDGDNEKSKSFATTEAIATTITARRFLVMTIRATKQALNMYGTDYPNMVNILQQEKVNSAFNIINVAYKKETTKIKDIDLSKDELCSKAQMNVIATISNRLFHKAVSESLKMNTLS